MENTMGFFWLCTIILIFTPNFGGCLRRSTSEYYGTLIGPLQNYAHGIEGTVYAIDESTIFVKGFSYDGTGPDAYFWVGHQTPHPSPNGTLVPYPEDYIGSDPPRLKAYTNADIMLRLPQGKKIRDIKWLSVWCRRFTVDFGDVMIPPHLDIPKPRVLPEFSRLAHGLRSGNISILDSKTIYIPNLHYDGAGPDAYFWVGNGSEPNSVGLKVPNEVGGTTKLRGYQGEDIEIVLPGNLTVFDIDWLSVWCVHYKHNFGHVMIPKNLDVPPALGQTKITPPWWYNPTSMSPPIAGMMPPSSTQELSNCKELLEGRVQVQWELIDEDVQIRLSGRISEDQYVAFGLSGKEGEAQMSGGDVVVVGYDKKNKKFIAVDYYMSDFAQCDGQQGVCPDERVGGRNDAVLIDGKRENGITTVTYIRPMRTNEPVKDRMIPYGETSIIAAIGTLNDRAEANAHWAGDKTQEDIRIDFTAKNIQECSNSIHNIANDPEDELESWPPAIIIDESNFTARIGPTGGKRGYYKITGKPSWGIAWYINDMLIPEITVERGQTYTFIVEGGNDSTNGARYHPFYITSSPEGGFGQKTEEQQNAEKVFAGVKWGADGYPYPTAAGRYCEWVHKTVDMSADSLTFDSFLETLRLDCNQGEPAKLIWTVAQDTPDLVYYQCYTHRNLGWKIHVEAPGYKSRITSAAITNSMNTLLMSIIIMTGFYALYR